MQLSDFTIDSLPDGKHIVIWFNNVNRFKYKPEDFFIIFVIQDLQTNEERIIYWNVKESPDWNVPYKLDTN